jgi:hypothetical protein
LVKLGRLEASEEQTKTEEIGKNGVGCERGNSGKQAGSNKRLPKSWERVKGR